MHTADGPSRLLTLHFCSAQRRGKVTFENYHAEQRLQRRFVKSIWSNVIVVFNLPLELGNLLPSDAVLFWGNECYC